VIPVRATGATIAAVAVATLAAVAQPAVAASAADVARAAIEDVQAFWTTTLPDLYGREYQSIPDDRLHPYDAQNAPPACGGTGTTPYEEVAGNAFYCPEDDFVAWDDQALIPKLEERFGDLAAALVFAHEWGHVIQRQTGTSSDATIPLELQADCFAGAWARHAVKTTGDPLDVKPRELEQALSGYLYFRDPVGTSPAQEGAHGSAFDRISAFSDGFSNGATRCKAYETDPPTITEIPFTSSTDLANEGNLPFGELVPSVRRDLNEYWTGLVGKAPVSKVDADTAKATRCGAKAGRPVVACDDGTVAYLPGALRAAYSTYGDFAVATVLAEAWGDAGARAAGARRADAPDRRLEECLAGAWAGGLVSGTRSSGSSLSPGDLDESVAVLLASPGRRTAGNDAFVRFRAFRTGFADGARACGVRRSG
jgi:predicted metalloprotease